MVIGRKPTTTISLNQHSPYIYYICPYTYRYVVITPHLGNLVWNIQRTLQKNHNQSKCRVVEPSSKGYIYKITSAPKFQEMFWKEGQDGCKNQKIRWFSVRLSPSYIKSYTPKVSSILLPNYKLVKNDTYKNDTMNI